MFNYFKNTDLSIEICKLVLEFLSNGPNLNRYSLVADKLNTTPDEVQLTIKALVLLIIETIKNNTSKRDFESVMFVIFSPEQTSIFWEFVVSQTEFIENILKFYNVTDLRYRDLEWRVETRIASRSLISQVVPIITIKLFVDAEEIGQNKNKLSKNLNCDHLKKIRCKEILFQTDPTNLLHIIDVLEQALEEAKTHRTKNFVKAIQQ